ncbi:MAG: flagellin [Synergistaceae bacterium]|nr:flagellin [Synergistaceae bacterium]
MRIYHNIPALTAYNSLNSTNTAMEKTIQKLSTGLRINSAADDAAGFAISEKMRSQISGLEVAIRNTQDATSMLQVAEGALGETNSMLQRMRELAVQASNDTLTSQDRSYIQLEIDQLADQIDRIANTTQFNKKRLLDGSSAGITTSSNLNVKAYVNGSLRSIDQFGQKKSFEGNYRIEVKVDPNQLGSGQVQKSSIMTIKHPNVITNVTTNTEDGITKVAVDSLPAGKYEVTADIASAGDSASIVGAYGFKNTSDPSNVTNMMSDDIVSASLFTINAAGGTNNYLNNASILFEVTSVTNDTDGTIKSVTLKAQSNILKADGTVENAVRENIILEDGAAALNLSDLVGGKIGYESDGTTPYDTIFDMAYAKPTGVEFGTGAKFVVNVTGDGGDINYTPNDSTDDATANMSVTVQGKIDTSWPDTWEGEFLDTSGAQADPANPNDGDAYYVSKFLTYNLNDEACRNKDIHFRNFYVNSTNGTIYQGDVILTTSDKFDTSGTNPTIASGDTLAEFTAAYIGKTATSDTKLRDINTFWNSSGVFMLEDPKTITISQGDGKQTSITVYATDTVEELRKKFNDAIRDGLGQGQYLNGVGSDEFCSFVDPSNVDTQGLETVGGTFLFRSILPGSRGDLTFTGDEDLLNTFAMNVVQSSSTAAFTANIYNAHTGTRVGETVKVADNRLIGVLHPNVDIEFSPMANIEAVWSDAEKNFILQGKDGIETAVIHIVDSSTVFQIGANEGEDIAIDIGNMSAGALGVTNINVSTRQTASAAIGQIDSAINKISTQRAKIGAYQNALEYTSENLTTTMTNLTAAESRIRDADMAATMMEFVKLQILNQSGTSMLAQANQLPQSVLSLLQG